MTSNAYSTTDTYYTNHAKIKLSGLKTFATKFKKANIEGTYIETTDKCNVVKDFLEIVSKFPIAALVVR